MLNSSMYYRACFILCVSCHVFASEKWLDPHEIKLDTRYVTDTPDSDLDLKCQGTVKGEMVLMYYKRSLKILTRHLAPKQSDRSTYDFNLHIDSLYYNDLMRAIEDVSYDTANLKNLDDALLQVEGRRLADQMQDTVLSWLEYIKMNFFTKEAAVLAFTLMLPIIVYCYKFASRQTIVLIVFFVIWAADFSITWFDKYQDLEVDHMVDMSRYASSEPTCDLTKMWFFERWFTSLSPTEECKRYYAARYKNRNYQIGPYDVIIDQTGKLMRIFRFVATESSNFLTLLTANIPWPLNWVVIFVVVILGFSVVLLVLFLLFGYSFRFNIAHLINFDIRNDQHPRVNNIQENGEFRQLIQEVRQIPIHMVEAVREIAKVIQRNPVVNQPVQQASQQTDNIIRDVNQGRTDNLNLLTVNNPPSVDIERVTSETQTSHSTTSDSIRPTEAVAEARENVVDHRPEILEEIKGNNDKDDSSSESIEVIGDANRNADFAEYVIVNQGSGDSIRNLDID